MTFSSPFHVPGAFHVEGVHPGLFRPPVSVPSPSSDYIPALESLPKRKRHHDDISRRHASTASDAYACGDGYFNTPAAAASSHRAYVLAGQLDTPSGAPSDHGILGESSYSDSDYRRVLGSKRPCGDNMDIDEPGPTQLYNLPPQPRPAQTWSSVAFATLGGVVGRVWDFCRSSTFKGFYAGGGKGFDAHAAPTSELFDSMITEKQGTAHERTQASRYPTVDTFTASRAEEETYDDDSRASTPTRPAAKRRQTDQSDDLGRNWVMVNESSKTEKAPRRPPLQQPSPRNRNQAPSVTTGRRKSTPAARLASAANQPSRRPVSRLSHANSTSSLNPPPPRPASSASYASPRSPSPSKIPRLATPSQIQSSPTPASSSRRRSTIVPNLTSPGSFSHRRTQSVASAASSRASAHEASEDRANVDASPRLDLEAKQLAARRRLEERDADIRMAAFNKRLQAMIRQGKEALGTTIEVDSAGGGGWEDED